MNYHKNIAQKTNAKLKENDEKISSITKYLLTCFLLKYKTQSLKK